MALKEEMEVIATVVEHQLDELDKHLEWIKQKEQAIKEINEEQ